METLIFLVGAQATGPRTDGPITGTWANLMCSPLCFDVYESSASSFVRKDGWPQIERSVVPSSETD